MTATNKSDRFSAEESAATKDRAKELKTQANGSDGEADVLAMIDERPPEDRALASRFHQLVHEVAHELRERFPDQPERQLCTEPRSIRPSTPPTSTSPGLPGGADAAVAQTPAVAHERRGWNAVAGWLR